MIGADGGHSSIVRILLNRGADLSLVGQEGFTPLLLSAQNGHLEVMTTLMEAGADLHATTDLGLSALSLASRFGHLESVRVLIKVGADIQATCSDGFTPLHMAAEGGHVMVVEELVGAGADPQPKTSACLTPLHVAARGGFTKVFTALVKAGADLQATNAKGTTPLHSAADEGHWAVVKALTEAGANPDARVISGETPLSCAAARGHLKVVKVLLRAKANPLLTSTHSPFGHDTTFVPLDGAAKNGHTAVVKELIQQVGIERCAGASGGMDALLLAAEDHHVGVMALLTEAGVVDTGEALHVSARSGQVDAVKLLLRQQRRRPVDGTIADTCNMALRCAIGHGECSPRVARLLIDAGADITSAATGVCGARHNETILGTTIRMLREKNACGKEAKEQQLHELEGIRRLLLRLEAVRAVSWAWPRDAPIIEHASESSRTSNTASKPLRMMVPALRRRAKRRRLVLLRALLRCVAWYGKGGIDGFVGVLLCAGPAVRGLARHPAAADFFFQPKFITPVRLEIFLA